MSTIVFAKFRRAPLRIKKSFGIFRELITTTTRVAFWDLPSGSKNCAVAQMHLEKICVLSNAWCRVRIHIKQRFHTLLQVKYTFHVECMACNVLHDCFSS